MPGVDIDCAAVTGVERAGIDTGFIGDLQRVGLDGDTPGIAVSEAIAGHATFLGDDDGKSLDRHLAGVAIIMSARDSEVLAPGIDHV